MSEEVAEPTPVVEETEKIAESTTTGVDQADASGEAEASTSRVEEVATTEAAAGEDDVTMDESDDDKKQRACRQSELVKRFSVVK